MKTPSDLRSEFLRRRMEFIHTELDTGAALVRLAQTERGLGRPDRAERQIELAQRACQEAERRIGECERAEWTAPFDAAQSKLAELKRLISEFRGGGISPDE